MALSRAAASFPYEVIEKIIDGCAGDVESLRAFALTCRDLLPRSRTHLFRDICVNSKEQRLALSKFLHARPAFRSLIHSIFYDCFQQHSSYPEFSRPALSLTEVIPMPVPSQFCNLRRWTLMAWSEHPIDIHPKALLFFKSYPCLEELDLIGCRFRSRIQFFLFVTAFLRLRTLRLKVTTFQNKAGQGEDHGGRPLRLSTLIVSDANDVSPDTTNVASRIIRLSRSSLLHLDLSDIKDYSHNSQRLFERISMLTQLRSLTAKWSVGWFDIIRVCTNAIRAVSSSAFERVSIRLSWDLDRFHTLRKEFCHVRVAEECREFDKAVNALCGGRVTLVFTLLTVKTNRRELASSIFRDVFPTLHSRDRLRVKLAQSHNALPGHNRAVRSLVVSPDGHLLASSADDRSIILWDVSGRDLRVLRDWEVSGDWFGVIPLAFSPDSTRLAAADEVNSAQHVSNPNACDMSVWDIQGEKMATLQGNQRRIDTICWSPDGSLLMSGSHNETVILWDAHAFQLLHRFETGTSSCFPVLSPDGRWLATGDGDMGQCTVWEVSTFRRHATFSLGHCHIESLLDNGLLLAIDSGSERLAAAFSTMEPEFAVIYVFGILGTETLTIPTGHSSHILQLVFSPDGKAILSASSDSTIKVWNSLTGALLLSLEGHRHTINAVCFSLDGKYIASASSDKFVRLWGTSDGLCVATFGEHRSQVHHVVFSPDGETLFSAAWDGTVCMRRLRDIITGYGI